jgi:protein-S-isoprenylcysteine O-methyltransferase Ste14
MSDAGAPQTSGVRFPPPLIYVAGLLAAWLLDRLVALPALDDAWGGILSIVCFVIGGALLLSSFRLFRRGRIDVRPWRPTSALTLSGPYRFTRNPMYLGMAFVYVGFALLFELTWALLLLPIVLLVVQTQVIAREERYLEARFGAEYHAYRARVRRWL